MSYTYTRALAKTMRQVATMVYATYMPENRGHVVLDSYLELMLPGRSVASTKSVFLQWYREKYSPTYGETESLLEHQLLEQAPLAVCGMLNEFADQVDRVVDAADIFDASAKLIEEKGWIQGRSGNVNEGFCLLGAIDYSLRSSERSTLWQDTLWHDCRYILHEYLQTSLTVEWNDAPGRKPEEAIHLLREIAAGVRIVKSG